MAPIVTCDPAFRFQPLKQARSRKWGQDIEGRVLNAGLFQKVDRFAKNGGGIAVKAKHNPGLHSDAMRINPPDDPGIIVHLVEAFVDLVHAGL